jgi:hypothetical protein
MLDRDIFIHIKMTRALPNTPRPHLSSDTDKRLYNTNTIPFIGVKLAELSRSLFQPDRPVNACRMR